MLSNLTALSRQPEWRSLRYFRLLSLQHCPSLQGLVRDTAKPRWPARLYAGLQAVTGLALPVTLYGVFRHDWIFPLQVAAGVGSGILAISVAWARAARECNRMGLWNMFLGAVDFIRLRRLVLDAPCAVLLVRYRQHFVNLDDAREVMLRLATACAKRDGVFLDHAMTTTKQAQFYAGDLANRLVDYSDDKPASERNLCQDLLAVCEKIEWLHADTARAMLHAGFRMPA